MSRTGRSLAGLVGAACLFFPVRTFAQDGPADVTIVYPREGANLPALDRSFVLGAVRPPSATLLLNGATVPVYRTGSYLASIPFRPGAFTIRAQAFLNGASTEAVRTVLVSSPPQVLPENPARISAEGLRPSPDMELSPGDRLDLFFRGSTGGTAEYRLKGLPRGSPGSRWSLMAPGASPGTYEASVFIGPEDVPGEARALYRLKGARGGRAKAAAPGKLRLVPMGHFRVAEVRETAATLLAGPSSGPEMMGYDLFVPRGVRFRTRGRSGSEVRVILSGTESVWTDVKNISFLPEGTPAPRAVLSRAWTEAGTRGLSAGFELGEKVAYRAVLSRDLSLLTIRLFDAVSNLDRVAYGAGALNDRIGTIRWKQSSENTVDLELELKEKAWGYELSYRGGTLFCEVLFAPKVRNGRLPLKGLTVAVDPGHSPRIGDGAVSPQGAAEGRVNYAIASCLKEHLKKMGASVVLTRGPDEGPDLAARTRLAREAGADLMVSVHANAVPDGADPYKSSGFSAYFFQPQSAALARKVHAAYRKIPGISDNGILYANLAVVRPTRFPSVLTESGFLIRPDEEERLLSKDFQCLCARAMAEGVSDFIKTFGKED